MRQDIIAAVATPPGEGGVALVRVSGSDCLKIISSFFRPANAKNPASFPGYTLRYGQIFDGSNGEIIDDGLLSLFRNPHSYTGEDAFEISCHGGGATTARTLGAILRAGARLAEPGEFTQRAFFNGKIDLAQAEAVADVIRASGESAQRIARRQLEGDLSKVVRKLRDELIGVLAAIEVTIDFSEEVGELEYEPLLARLREADAETGRLIATANHGKALREGFRIALIGKPNVGKSSLFNALLGEDRSIVTDAPGTTRDLLEETANIEGYPLLFADLAGIRETENLAEKLGVERAEKAAQTSDLILFVIDASDGFDEGDLQAFKKIDRADLARMIAIANKCDVAEAKEIERCEAEIRKVAPDAEFLKLSSKTGDGIPELKHLLVRTIGGKDFRSDATDRSVVVSNARHHEALFSAKERLVEAIKTTELRLPGDFIAIDARGALDFLGLITGETVTDDIVHRIFKDFCVGK